MAVDLDRDYFDYLCEFVGFIPHPAQVEVIDKFFAGERFMGINAGRRWGKSELAALFLLYGLGQENKTLWLVAPSYTLCGKIWHYLVPWVHKVYGSDARILRSSPAKIITKWDTVLENKSTDNPDSCIGDGVDMLAFDEAATEKKGKTIWQQQIRSTLIDTIGQAIFPSTPRGPGWLPEMLEKAKAWVGTFPSHSNPHLSREELEEMKETLDPLFYRQEILAEIVTFAGAVYPMFSTTEHMITDERAMDMTRGWTTCIIVDPGIGNPTCIQLIKHSSVHGQDVVIKDYQERGMLFEDVLRIINEWEPPEGYEALICDIAGRQRSQETGRSFVGWMRENGRKFQHTSVKSVSDGISLVRGRLKNMNGVIRVWIAEAAKNTKKGLVNYHFPENKSGSAGEDPVKDNINDHSMDDFRYYITWRYRGTSKAVKH